MKCFALFAVFVVVVLFYEVKTGRNSAKYAVIHQDNTETNGTHSSHTYSNASSYDSTSYDSISYDSTSDNSNFYNYTTSYDPINQATSYYTISNKATKNYSPSRNCYYRVIIKTATSNIYGSNGI
uniref:Uncharacterized protein n=1 Tax=Anopheles albimanus TaxID=7167 RepID=A0A182FS78_ANOAL